MIAKALPSSPTSLTVTSGYWTPDSEMVHLLSSHHSAEARYRSHPGLPGVSLTKPSYIIQTRLSSNFARFFNEIMLDIPSQVV